MKRKVCKNCTKYRQLYYKGKYGLVMSSFGKCAKQSGKLTELKGVCEFFEKREDQDIAALRQKNVLLGLSALLEQLKDLLLVLSSDNQESVKY